MTSLKGGASSPPFSAFVGLTRAFQIQVTTIVIILNVKTTLLINPALALMFARMHTSFGAELAPCLQLHFTS
jgi:hypothetical protein